ncbi:MAG: T9SS type A sorting domain-containing protein [Chitinophagales bacterium]
MKKHHLLSYSAAAAIFLLHQKEAGAQVVYTDIDPDAGFYGDPSFLDLNGDGIVELHFGHDWFYTFTSFGGGTWGYSTNRFYIDNYASVANALILDSSVVVGGATPFTDLTPINLLHCSRDFPDDFTIFSGTEWLNRDSFVGVKFEIDGETHYGWVRLSVSVPPGGTHAYFLIKDYAYNATADEPIVTQLFDASVPFDLELSDIGETNTAADLQLTFTKAANENTVSAYRVILYKGVWFPDLAEAEAVSADRYTAILPGGEDIEMTFTPETRDMDGDLLTPDTQYKAIVLSIADGELVNKNALSVTSNFSGFSLYAAPELFLNFSCDFIHTDASAFTTSYYVYQPGADSVRLYITGDDTHTLDELLTLDSDYYMEGTLDDGYNYVYFTADKLVTDTVLVPYEKYYCNAISFPDMEWTTYPSLSVSYPNYFMLKYLDYTPEVILHEPMDDPSDIEVRFPMVSDEFLVEGYRIIVVPAGEGLTNEHLYGLSSWAYVHLLPTGSDIDKFLPSSVKDVHLHPLEAGQSYQIYYAMENHYSPAFSLSAPSITFQLEEAPVDTSQEETALDGIPDIACLVTVSNGYIHLELETPGNYAASLLDEQGRLLKKCTFQDDHLHLPVFDLPAGLYIIQLLGEGCMHTEKIILP